MLMCVCVCIDILFVVVVAAPTLAVTNRALAAKKPKVVKMDNGIEYVDLNVGKGESPHPGDLVIVVRRQLTHVNSRKRTYGEGVLT